MTVYKGYMKIVKRNMGLILMYVAIFAGITVIFQHFSSLDSTGSYQAESVRIGVIDEDRGSLAKELQSYLGQFHEVTRAEHDKARLQEDLFYRNVEYIIWIPEDFFETCIVEGKALTVTKVPGSYTAFYVDQQINSFLNNARVFHAAGFDQEEAAESLEKLEPAQVELLDTGRVSGEKSAYGFYFRYIPYLFLSVLCYVMGNVISAFRKGDLPKRMRACAVSGRRQNVEGLLAAATVGMCLWALCIGGAFFWYKDILTERGGVGYFLLNTLLMLLVALTISYLVGMFVHGKNGVNTLNGIVNVLSLGLGFLCGVFVPLELMNKSVKNVSQFLPVYWYEVVNDYLVEFGNVTGEVKQAVLQGLGMQLAFVAALVCVTLTVSKWKRV
ncbi:hypothetical protein C808_00847 [Lachnospiraceae bacterium M18-1]|nr:hypothetical protein C808_00847 [Lachnospiraceae bacterium M18-1]